MLKETPASIVHDAPAAESRAGPDFAFGSLLVHNERRESFHQFGLWQLTLLVTIILLIPAIGVSHLIDAGRRTNHSGIRADGEMPLERKQLTFEIAGALLTLFALFIRPLLFFIS